MNRGGGIDGQGPRFGMVKVGRLRLRVSVRGEGPPLLLISGIGASVEMWRPFESRIESSAVITFDLPGAGRSPRTALPSRMRALASITADLLHSLGHESADVLGYSLGGAVAQQLAHDAPERVRRLILVSTTCGLGGRLPNLGNFLAMLTPARYYSRSYFERVGPGLYGGRSRDVAALEAQFRQRSLSPPDWLGYAMQMYAIWGWTSRPWLHRLTHRTLVMSGDDDPLVPVQNSYLLASHIPNAQLRVVPGAGHLFLLDDPEEPAAAVNGFLRRQRPHQSVRPTSRSPRRNRERPAAQDQLSGSVPPVDLARIHRPTRG